MTQDNTHVVNLLNQRDAWDKKWKGGNPPQKEIKKRSLLEFSITREWNKLKEAQTKDAIKSLIVC